MKNITNRILLFSLFAICLVYSAFSQPVPKAPISQMSDVWQVNYRVLVKGEFTIEPELGSEGPTIFYHLKREYNGKANLRFEPKASDPRSGITKPLFKDPASSIHIEINDFIHTIYPVICDEFKSIEERWTADVYTMFGDEKMPSPGLLLIDNQTRNYKTSFPLLYTAPLNIYDIHYKRAEFNHPGHKETSSSSKNLHFATHDYPNVKGYIERNSIMRTPPWSELTAHEGGHLSWLSPILHPDAPLIEGVPESKDKVTILIHYILTKVEKK